MSRFIRGVLILTGIVTFALGVAFYLRWSFVGDLWPWSGGYYGSGDLSRLSFYFLSSILMAIALPNLWIGWTGELAAVTGGALNLGIAYLGIGVYMLMSHKSGSSDRLLPAGLFCLVGAGVSAGLVVWSWRIPFRDERPMPVIVRAAFGVFAVVLVVAGGALLLKKPHIFPWPLRDEVSVVYGWIFVGAAAYFVYGVLVPRWHNACGQLLGFLAYDLVLIVPFIGHFSEVRPEHRNSLIIYTTVVVLSGILAVYYVFVHPRTRMSRDVRQTLVELTGGFFL